MQFSPTSHHFIPLWSNYSPHHPGLKHPQSMFLPLLNMLMYEWMKLSIMRYTKITFCMKLFCMLKYDWSCLVYVFDRCVFLFIFYLIFSHVFIFLFFHLLLFLFWLVCRRPDKGRWSRCDYCVECVEQNAAIRVTSKFQSSLQAVRPVQERLSRNCMSLIARNQIVNEYPAAAYRSSTLRHDIP
jgi:hypothetical protein